MRVVEFLVAGILALTGVRSLVSWFRNEFEAASVTEQILYSLHVTSRVGTWFALAGFFAGHALVDEPQRFGWYVFVLIGLGGMQLLTGLLLARAPSSLHSGDGDAGRD